MCPKAEDIHAGEAELNKHLGGMIEHLNWAGSDQLKVFKKTTNKWNGN